MGVHVDLWRGSLEFYLNRKPLGVAFTNLRGKTVFPVICSTAAKSSLTLSTAQSLPSSLQFLAVRSLAHKLPGSTLLSLLLPPGIRNFIRNNYWFFIDHSASLPTPFYATVTPSIPTSSGGLRMLAPDQLEKREGGEDTETEDEDCFLVTPEGRKEAKEALMAKCVALGEQNKRSRTTQKVKKNMEGTKSKAVDKNVLEKDLMGTGDEKKMPVGEGETTEEEETPPRNIKRFSFCFLHCFSFMRLLSGFDYALQRSEGWCIVGCFAGSKNCLCCYIIVRNGFHINSVPVNHNEVLLL